MFPSPRPDPDPCAFGVGLGPAVAEIRTVAPIDRRLAGFDHGAVEDLAGGQVDDLGDLAPVAVGVVDLEIDHLRGDLAQVVAALGASGALGDLVRR